AVVTAGTRAHGVFLQSIGGGGGAVLSDLGETEGASVALSDANSGDGGDILLRQTGGVAVFGAGAYGVIAQSLGGGGGWVDGVFAGSAGGAGAGGRIDLDVSGPLMALGAGGVALFAQSLGAAGGGDIAIAVEDLVR